MKVTHLNPSLRLPWLGEVELKEVVMFAVGGHSARLQVHPHLWDYVFVQKIPNDKGFKGPSRPQFFFHSGLSIDYSQICFLTSGPSTILISSPMQLTKQDEVCPGNPLIKIDFSFFSLSSFSSLSSSSASSSSPTHRCGRPRRVRSGQVTH